MKVFNANRMIKHSVAGMYAGPYSNAVTRELLLFLFDGTGGIPESIDDEFTGNLDSLEDFTRKSFAYGVLNGQEALNDTEDKGYRANLNFLTLKHPTVSPELFSCVDGNNQPVSAPSHVRYNATWINGVGTGTSDAQVPSIAGINKCMAFNYNINRLAVPHICAGISFLSLSTNALQAFVYEFDAPITVDCYTIDLLFYKSGSPASAMTVFTVQYWDGSAWVSLATTGQNTLTAGNNLRRQYFLQFPSVTAASFRLLHSQSGVQMAALSFANGYFGNTDPAVIAAVPVFTYPETMYGIVVANTVLYGRVNAGNPSNIDQGFQGPVTSPVRAFALASDQDRDVFVLSSNSTPAPSVMCDVTGLAGNGRVKVPLLNTDPLDHFGFNNVIVDIF